MLKLGKFSWQSFTMFAEVENFESVSGILMFRPKTFCENAVSFYWQFFFCIKKVDVKTNPKAFVTCLIIGKRIGNGYGQKLSARCWFFKNFLASRMPGCRTFSTSENRLTHQINPPPPNLNKSNKVLISTVCWSKIISRLNIFPDKNFSFEQKS